MALDDFYGIWSFDPTEARYGERAAPTRGVYALWPAAGRVCFAVGWTDAKGAARATSFALVPDGEAHTLEGGPEVRCALEDDALITEVVGDDGPSAYASRSLIDADTMEVLQRDAEGETRGIYRRDAVKQVICYRRDLKMRKGKIAAQCAHASLSVILRRGHITGLSASLELTPEMAYWTARRFAKVVLSVDDEESLVKVHEEAEARGLPTSLIRDAGRTEFKGVPTLTTVAVGPALASEIDVVTGPRGVVRTKLA